MLLLTDRFPVPEILNIHTSSGALNIYEAREPEKFFAALFRNRNDRTVYLHFRTNEATEEVKSSGLFPTNEFVSVDTIPHLSILDQVFYHATERDGSTKWFVVDIIAKP